jgi:hypothetical protein
MPTTVIDGVEAAPRRDPCGTCAPGVEPARTYDKPPIGIYIEEEVETLTCRSRSQSSYRLEPMVLSAKLTVLARPGQSPRASTGRVCKGQQYVVDDPIRPDH